MKKSTTFFIISLTVYALLITYPISATANTAIKFNGYNSFIEMTPWTPSGDYKIIVWLGNTVVERGERIFIASNSETNEYLSYFSHSIQAQFGKSWPGIWGKMDFNKTKFLEVTFKKGVMLISDGVNNAHTFDPNISPTSVSYDRLFRRGNIYSKGTLQAISFIDLNNIKNSRSIAFDKNGSPKVIPLNNASIIINNVNKHDLIHDLKIPVANIKWVESAEQLGALIESTYPVLPLLSESQETLDAVNFAWEGHYWLRTYINLYKATNDTMYIEWAIELANFIFENTDEKRAERNNLVRNSYNLAPKYYLKNRTEFSPGWMNSSSKTVSILNDGMVLNAVMRLVDVIKTNSLDKFNDLADKYIELSIEIVKSHNSSWSETKQSSISGSWYYVAPNEHYGDAGLWSNPRAFNHLMTMGTAIIYLDKWLGGIPEYKNKLKKIEGFFNDYLIHNNDGTCVWNYSWELNGNETIEDSSHGHLDVGFIIVADQEGYLKNSEIPECMAKTVIQKMLIGPGLISNKVDGSGIAIKTEQLAVTYDYRALIKYQPSIRELTDNIIYQLGNPSWFREYTAISESFIEY
ncbi:hypothetical protein CWB76_08920 [Pseudoalteromonas sp. S1609]|uniref:hypothetical protein n=1 Tax=Pseudoalteromonas sp. S1609 TaxID=579505 RepID=UPI00110A62B1|nr:hypothetical protein [Pseudoalteromonas sp. S1609]TMP70801.1 hypothetical protein CWB76_08920 [Pseudoalteromonas sp. S1609]